MAKSMFYTKQDIIETYNHNRLRNVCGCWITFNAFERDANANVVFLMEEWQLTSMFFIVAPKYLLLAMHFKRRTIASCNNKMPKFTNVEGVTYETTGRTVRWQDHKVIAMFKLYDHQNNSEFYDKSVEKWPLRIVQVYLC